MTLDTNNLEDTMYGLGLPTFISISLESSVDAKSPGVGVWYIRLSPVSGKGVGIGVCIGVCGQNWPPQG